jgi:hypothetical protein
MRLSISTTRGASDVSEGPLYTSEEVVSMNEKKQFVEPELVKCKESLDKVTLCYNNYSENGNNDQWDFLKRHRGPKGRHH